MLRYTVNFVDETKLNLIKICAGKANRRGGYSTATSVTIRSHNYDTKTTVIEFKNVEAAISFGMQYGIITKGNV